MRKGVFPFNCMIQALKSTVDKQWQYNILNINDYLSNKSYENF